MKKNKKKVVVRGLESLFDDAGDNAGGSAEHGLVSLFDKRVAA